MSVHFEIACAAATNSLTLFTGTGFSKALTDNNAPGWQQLLVNICNMHSSSSGLVAELFPADGKNPLSLEEAAQVIQVQLASAGRDIHAEIAKQIAQVKLVGPNHAVTSFLKDNPVSVVTTNYDKLVEALVDPHDSLSFAPGLPVPRGTAKTTVYHVHGSIDSPANMVVTADDYFKFINNESFFSRKLSTLLHERTVLILGYSLGDTNLKAILSDYKGFSRRHFTGGNILLVSREAVSQIIKDYYSQSYGIRVVDQTNVEHFFTMVNLHMTAARETAKQVVVNTNEVLFGGKIWTDDYLKKQLSFYEIVAGVAAIGRSVSDPQVVAMLKTVIERKTVFTGHTNAWHEYEHLAHWLILLGSILEIRGTALEAIFVDAVVQSMNTMSSNQIRGYSWHAYGHWSRGWSNVIPANRALIRESCGERLIRAEATALINSA
ncbi:SIR2 family protein [Burkholderia gladioli]|nr:SIR2 family protein [Burkholderia gladioli]